MIAVNNCELCDLNARARPEKSTNWVKLLITFIVE